MHRSGKPSDDTWELVLGANGYRLPTGAEWEFACRAGTATEFSHGDEESLLGKYAVLWASRTEPCGSKLPNGWGLFDMHGNLFEWCQDWYELEAYGNATAVDDPTGPTAGSFRVNRGGSWGLHAWFCQTAYRHRDQPSHRSDSLGFRLAFSPVDASGR